MSKDAAVPDLKRMRVPIAPDQSATAQPSWTLLGSLPRECAEHMATYLCLGGLAHLSLASGGLHNACRAYLEVARSIETCGASCCDPRAADPNNVRTGMWLLARHARQLERLVVDGENVPNTARYWDTVARVIAHCSGALRFVEVAAYTNSVVAALTQCGHLQTLPRFHRAKLDDSSINDMMLRVLGRSRSLTHVDIDGFAYSRAVFEALFRSECPLKYVELSGAPPTALSLLARHAATLRTLILGPVEQEPVDHEHLDVCAALAALLPSLVGLTALDVTVNRFQRSLDARETALHAWHLSPSVTSLRLHGIRTRRITNVFPSVYAPGLLTLSSTSMSAEGLAHLLAHAPRIRTCASHYMKRAGDPGNRTLERAIGGFAGSALTEVVLHRRSLTASTLGAMSLAWRALHTLECLVHSRVTSSQLVTFLRALPSTVVELKLRNRFRPRSELTRLLTYGRAEISEEATTTPASATDPAVPDQAECLLPRLVRLWVPLRARELLRARLACPSLEDLSCRDGGDIAHLLRRYPDLRSLSVRAYGERERDAPGESWCTARRFESPLGLLRLRLVAFDGCPRALLSWCPGLERIELMYVRPHTLLGVALCDDCVPLLDSVTVCGNLDGGFPVCTLESVRALIDSFPRLRRVYFNRGDGSRNDDDYLPPANFWIDIPDAVRHQLAGYLASRLCTRAPHLIVCGRQIRPAATDT